MDLLRTITYQQGVKMCEQPLGKAADLCFNKRQEDLTCTNAELSRIITDPATGKCYCRGKVLGKVNTKCMWSEWKAKGLRATLLQDLAPAVKPSLQNLKNMKGVNSRSHRLCRMRNNSKNSTDQAAGVAREIMNLSGFWPFVELSTCGNCNQRVSPGALVNY